MSDTATHRPLALNSARVTSTTSDLSYDRVKVTVVEGVAQIDTQAAALLTAKTGVTSVEQSATGWTVTFEDSEQWIVARAGGGCGCGQ